MRRFVSKVTEKTDKLSKEQLQRLIKNLSIELETASSENEDFWAIFESLSTGLLIVDDKGNLLYSNTSAERLLSLSLSGEVNSDMWPVWNLIGEEEISLYVKNCFSKKITNASEEFTISTEGGAVRFLSLNMSPLVKENTLSGNIISVKDITDRKNQDVLLHRMENLASLTNLAAGMAHEIKNPLGAISIHIQLVQKALQKARENNDTLPARKFVEDHIDVVNEEIEHLNSLVMDFLFAVRPVNAKLELKNPVTIINTVADFFRPEFKRNGISFETDLAEKDARILIDEKLFREIIMNIAHNAQAAIQSKFSECKEDVAGDETPGRFKIVNCIRDGKYIIAIADNGCGMNKETLAKLFEPYFTTKANGTGLGMTMVYKIVKEFSGDICVDSTEGVGTNFVLSFPLPQSETKLLG